MQTDEHRSFGSQVASHLCSSVCIRGKSAIAFLRALRVSVVNYLEIRGDMFRISKIGLACAVVVVGFAQLAIAQPATKPAKSPEQVEAQYTESLNKRANDVVAAAGVTDAAKMSRVHDALVDHW